MMLMAREPRGTVSRVERTDRLRICSPIPVNCSASYLWLTSRRMEPRAAWVVVLGSQARVMKTFSPMLSPAPHRETKVAACLSKSPPTRTIRPLPRPSVLMAPILEQ